MAKMGWGISAEGVGLFILAAAESFNVYSAFCSSPWTIENVGADEQKGRSAMYYSAMAGGANVGLGLGASLLARSWWPLVGTSAVTVLMLIIYKRALQKAQETGARGWQS
jgi:hypothetical protein